MRLLTTTMLLLATAHAKGLGEDSGGAEEHGQQQRCYVCGGAAGSTCSVPASLLCPPDLPLCATSAVVSSTTAHQEHTSVLTCAGTHVRRPCSLAAHSDGLYEIYCVCTNRLCNAPFTKQLLDELQRFASANVFNGSNLIDQFLNYSTTVKDEIYGAVTDVMRNEIMELDDAEYSNAGEKMPVAVALSDGAVAPSDDEEGDGEGSGLDDDIQGHGKGLAPYAAPRTTTEPTSARAASRLYRPPILVSHLLLLVINI